MPGVQRAPAIRGKTIRLTWTDGPTKGTTHEHVFHDDGTVEWRDAANPQKGGPPVVIRSEDNWRQWSLHLK